MPELWGDDEAARRYLESWGFHPSQDDFWEDYYKPFPSPPNPYPEPPRWRWAPLLAPGLLLAVLAVLLLVIWSTP